MGPGAEAGTTRWKGSADPRAPSRLDSQEALMAAYNKFNQFVEDLCRKVHNLDTDTLKGMLTNTAPVATNAVKANITEITAQNGYAAGRTQAVFSSGAQSSGTFKLVLSDVTFTGS